MRVRQSESEILYVVSMCHACRVFVFLSVFGLEGKVVKRSAFRNGISCLSQNHYTPGEPVATALVIWVK